MVQVSLAGPQAGSSRFTAEIIATLTARDICRMSIDEMIEVVRASSIEVTSPQLLENLDSDALVRLVHAALQQCRARKLEAQGH